MTWLCAKLVGINLEANFTSWILQVIYHKGWSEENFKYGSNMCTLSIIHDEMDRASWVLIMAWNREYGS